MRLEVPLPPAVYLLLATLADGPAHGYRLRREIIARSGGTLRLDPGSLYRIISRLLDEALIEETSDPTPAGGPPRRAYRLSAAGRRLLMAETRRLSTLVKQVQSSAARRLRHT